MRDDRSLIRTRDGGELAKLTPDSRLTIYDPLRCRRRIGPPLRQVNRLSGAWQALSIYLDPLAWKALQEISPVVRQAICRSKRRRRQIWVVWIGRRIALRNTYRLGHGTLFALLLGDEIFPSDTLTTAFQAA